MRDPDEMQELTPGASPFDPAGARPAVSYATPRAASPRVRYQPESTPPRPAARPLSRQEEREEAIEDLTERHLVADCRPPDGVAAILERIGEVWGERALNEV